MKQRFLTPLLLISLLTSTGAIAGTIKVTGTIPTTVNIQQPRSHTASATSSSSAKRIVLMKIELNKDAKDNLAKVANQPAKPMLRAATSTATPASTQLAMNNVPVLDQGYHGSCVTFADSAALDAILGKTQYVSELCNLSLGSYLEAEAKKNNAEEYPSGWDGSLNFIVLGQMKQYGIISTTYQKQYGCGGATLLKEYPAYDENNTGTPMPASEFTRHSEMVMQNNIDWRYVVNPEDAFSNRTNMEKALEDVKKSLANGHRVVIGTLLDVNGNLGSVNGADGHYHNVKNDAWIINGQIRRDLAARNVNAGHAMVITGYDDNAVITGSDGTQHVGVLTLRNSWTSRAGDNGDYYMSYEYFKMMVFEVEELSPTPFN